MYKTLLFTILFTICLPIWAETRPNILWLSSEDNGPHIGAYGDELADTPNLDKLASQGTLYRHAWSTLPVCAPARTTIITGMYPSSFGGEHMRSMVPLPDHIKLFPQYLREAGYYCTNNSKEDYNVPKGPKVWDESSGNAHWKNRKDGQPFFAVFNFTTTHESQIRKRPHTPIHDPASMKIPAYHPDTPEVRQDWAQYYDKMTEMDAQVGQAIKELEEAGLENDTIIMYWGDHGMGLPRGKRNPHNSGLLVPMIVKIPQQFQDKMPRDFGIDKESERLIAFVDLAPTVLTLAGIDVPDHMQGQAFLGAKKLPKKQYIYGFRGRMDERYDRIRVIRDHRYLYMKNYMPHRPHGQYLTYQFETPTTQVMYKLYEEGKLSPEQAYFWEPKTSEELYDLEADPDEVNNLVDDPEHSHILKKMRKELSKRERNTQDVGLIPEPDMFTLHKGRIPYEVGQDTKNYNIKAIQSAAQRATASEFDPDIIALLSDKDPSIRYWAATGILVHHTTITVPLEELRPLLKDISPSARIVAAEVIAQHGEPRDVAQALTVLLDCANADKYHPTVSTFALNAIDYLGETARPIYEDLAKYSREQGKKASRYQKYPPRMLDRILTK